MTKSQSEPDRPSGFIAAWISLIKSPGRLLAACFLVGLVCAVPALADSASNPWTDGVNNLQSLMTGTVAKALSIVAIVVGGLMFAFGEGGSKKMLSGIIFGAGMAVGAANFLNWLFPNQGS